MIYRCALTILISVCIFNSSISQEIAPDYLSENMRKVQLACLATSLSVAMHSIFHGKDAFSSTPPATDLATRFVEKIAGDHGIANDYDVRLGDGYAAGIGTILLEHDWEYPDYNVSTIDSTLIGLANATTNQEQDAALEELYKHVGSLDHEFTHYKNNDLRNSLISSVAIHISLCAAWIALEANYLKNHLEKSSALQKWVYTLTSSLGLGALTTLADRLQLIFREKRADEGIRNEPLILNAKIKWAQHHQEQTKKLLAASPSWFWRKVGSLVEKYPSLYYLLDPVHPPLPYREARFKERLAELEKAQENAPVVNS